MKKKQAAIKPMFQVGQGMVSACCSLYHGYPGVITAVKRLPFGATKEGVLYSVTILANGSRAECQFFASQMSSLTEPRPVNWQCQDCTRDEEQCDRRVKRKTQKQWIPVGGYLKRWE